MATDLGSVQDFNKKPTSSGTDLGSVGKFDSARGMLSNSQSLLDRFRAESQAAQQASELANRPSTIAKETAKGTVNQLLSGPIRAVKSAIAAPVDAVRSLMGKGVDTTASKDFMGNDMQTYQGAIASGKPILPEIGSAALDVASVLPVGKGLSLAKPLLGKAGAAISKIASPVTKPIANYLAQRAEKKGLEAITNTIMPKPNAKEVKLALREGRIQPGRDPSLLRGGTPDEIMPSANTQKSAATIRQYVQGAEKLKAPELHTAIGEQVKVMGTSLRPVMDATPITPKTVGKITKDWEALKARQLADPYTPATANVQKLQQNFEVNFLQKSKSGNFGDLWDTRIAYDASVPANVKNATSLSSDTLQTQKELWLQNRRILNDAINDAKTGLGDVSSKTFEEMNDLYNAQKGIESSYKPVLESTTSKIKDFAKEHPFITGGAVYGANEASKRTTGVGIPTPF